MFACLVGNKDLLYTLYTPPTVSICRRDQQAKSLAVLGLPENAMQQVEALRGGSGSRVAPNSPENRSHTTLTALSPCIHPGTKSPRMSPTVHSLTERHKDSDGGSQAIGRGHQRPHKSDLIHSMHEAREPFWGPFDAQALEAATQPHTAGHVDISKRHPGRGPGDAFPEDLLQFDKPGLAVSREPFWVTTSHVSSLLIRPMHHPDDMYCMQRTPPAWACLPAEGAHVLEP